MVTVPLPPPNVGLVQPGTNLMSKFWYDYFSDSPPSDPIISMSFWDYLDDAAIAGIADGTFSDDLGEEWVAFRDAVAAAATAGRQVIAQVPAGTYWISTSPNWAIQYLQLVPLGRVILVYTGAEAGIRMDGSESDRVGGNVFGVSRIELGNFHVVASGAANAFFFKWVHRCTIQGTVLAGEPTNGNGFKIDGCVSSVFYNISITGNNEPMPTTPLLGCLVTGAAGFQSSFCTFVNPSFESSTRGLWLDFALGNVFFGGVCEGNTIGGCVLTAEAQNNRFFGMDFEANPFGGVGFDVFCAGKFNEWHAVDSTETGGVIFTSGALGNVIVGGVIDNINFESGSINNRVTSVTYNRTGAGAIVDHGTTNKFENLYNAVTGALHSGPSPAVFGENLGASPYTFINDTGNDKLVFLTGGNVTNVSFKQAATGATQGALGAGPHPPFLLRPGNVLVISYTGAPAIEYVYV